MCFTRFVRQRPYNLAGDQIVHDTIVLARRPIPGHPRATPYPIDVREFLVSERNAVMKDCVERKIGRDWIEQIGGDRELFTARRSGAFDYRAAVINTWVAAHIEHVADAGELGDTWLFPDETLHVRQGDCEDRALLLASLLLASGISPYNVRVAIGRLRFHVEGRVEAFDHAWVAYRSETGAWDVLEPVEPSAQAPRRLDQRRLLAAEREYVPAFVWNGDHVWQVESPVLAELQQETRRKKNKAKTAPDDQTFSLHVGTRLSWSRLQPAFTGNAHWSILDEAIAAYGRPTLDHVRRRFAYYFGHYVEEIDRPGNYDPVDHFDNCQIERGWERVQRRLGQFASLYGTERMRALDEFALAAHGIADFYAHTSYGHFAALEGDRFRVFDPGWLAQLDANLGTPARYDGSGAAPFDLVGTRFTVGPLFGSRPRAEVPRLWNGKLISGRYAHPGDAQGLWERITRMPAAYLQENTFWRTAGVPHHEEIAVDYQYGTNALYRKRAELEAQFLRRRRTAVAHLRQEFARVAGSPR